MKPSESNSQLRREILLAFWKVHILLHAAREPVTGRWMQRELEHHGHTLSPGTLYPIFHRMAEMGWIEELPNDARKNPKAPKPFRVTENGRAVLAELQHHVRELAKEMEELIPDHPSRRGSGPPER
jgi:DNA-binding PadR family transcriptional regulator